MNPILQTVLESAIPIIIAAIGSWIAVLYQRATDHQIDAQMLENLETFLKNVAGGFYKKKLETGQVITTTFVKDEAWDAAQKRIPETMAHFPAMTPDTLAEKVVEKVGILQA